MNYFISDLHFNDANTFNKEKRNIRFKSIEQMNSVLLDNINNTCGRQDVLYILGDISNAEYNPTLLLRKMKCKKILVVGNHDMRWKKRNDFCQEFIRIFDIGYVREYDTRITLCHYPICEWDGFMKGHWHFYGHIHKSNNGPGKYMDKLPHCVNTGADVNDFSPKTAGALIAGRIHKDIQQKRMSYENMMQSYKGINLRKKDKMNMCILDYLEELS